MLELDPTTVIMDVMIFYTNSVANGTHTPYTPSNFRPESYAVKVNCLFFASLSTSLVAALASVVALQWVADYDAAITRGGSSPEDRAKRRQFRHSGVVWWKMGEIIAALPLLLYCSVVLFFGGLGLWMWEVNNVVGLVVVGGAALAALFYGISTFLAVVFVSAPFRTPLGRWIYSSARLFFSSVYHLTGALRVPLIPAWLEKRNLTSSMSRRREDLEVEKRHGMGMAALVWLANELSVSQDAYGRFLLLVGELPKLKQEISSSSGFLEVPWYLIFDLLGWQNLKNTEAGSITQQDIDAFGVLAQCYRIPEIHEIISPTTQYVANASDDEYWSQYCEITAGQWSPQPSPARPNSLFLLLRDIPLPSTDIDIDIELTIRLSRWRNSTHLAVNTSEVLKIAPSISSADSTNESIVNVGTYPKADDFPLWILRDDEALYTGIVRRMMSTLETDGIIPHQLLDALRWRFEILLVWKEKVDKITCLSTPLQYHGALQSSSLSLRSLHYAFTLLLARNLNSFVGDERVFRFKEILMMLWVYPVDWDTRRGGNEVGMEKFFEENKAVVMEWIWDCQAIPYIHEILSHLGAAQAEEPKIGPLWRVTPPKEGDDPGLMGALSAFDFLIRRGVTPEQHCNLIGLVCRDLSLGPPEAFKGYFTDDTLESINNLHDPCLRLLAQSCAGSGGDYFHLSSEEIDGPLKGSWALMATYFMTHPEATSSPSILRLQGSLWPVIPNRGDLCSTALRDPEVFVSDSVPLALRLLNAHRLIYSARSNTQ
jgi:Family of unknown function (DUF6535)